MPSKRPPRPQSSPLLKALRLADRRARRGVLPSAALLAEWQASVDAALHEGSAEAPELRLRLAEIGALVFGQVASRTAIPEVDRREREIGRWWQAVFDAPQRGTLGELAERVAGHLARLPHPRRSTRLTPPRQPAMLGAPAPLPTTLTDEPDAHALRSNEFFLARQALTNGWLERMGLLARYGMQPGSYSFLDMPLVYDTDLELDWVEGEPDPFEEPRVIGPARQMAERMAAKGARVQLRRGREVPVDAYEPSEARAAEELLVVGAYGPVSLGSLSVLDQAVPVEERSGLLHLILAPGAVEAAKSLPVADVVTELDDLPPEERRNARPEETGPRTARRPESLPDETPDTPTFPSTTTGLELQGGERSEVGVARSVDTRASAARPTRPIVQVALDWVSGEDPWQTPEIIAEALTRLQVVASGAANVEIVRGRELPFERYAPAQAQAAADLVLLGPGHALPLAGVALLEGAVVELQRPGFLQVLIAPGAARTTRQPARPDPTSGRDYPELALAYEDEVAASEAPGDSGEVVRRVSWTGDLVPPEVSPAKIGQVAETRSQPPREVVPPATFGLLGVQSSEVPALGLGNTLGAATEPEPLAAPARVQPMRVIDRQTELRRAEWAREAQALDDSQSPASASAPSLAPTRPTSPLIPSESGPALDLAGPAPLDLPLVTEAAADEPAVAAEGTRTPVARQPVGEPPTTRAGEATAPVAGPSITPLGSTPGGTAVPPVSDTTAEVRSSVQRDEGQPGIPAPDQRPEAPSAERRPDAEPVGEWPGVQRAGEPATARRADEPAAGERSVEPSLAVEAPAALTTPGEAVPSPRPTDVEEPVRPSAGENVEFQTAEQVPTGGASQPSEVEAVPSVIVAREAGEVAPEVVPPAISSEPSVAQVVPVAAAEVDRAEARPVAYPDASTADVVAAEEGTVRGEPATAASTGGSSPAATGNFASGDDRAAEPAPLPRAPAGETIRLTIDWVSGEDPWADPRRLEPAREALRALADQGIKVELTRGREVPIGQYDSAQAQRAADFQMLTAAGPILLTGVDLLDAAVLVAQRPGALEVLLAPRTAAPATPGEQYRNIPELPLVLPEEPAEPGEEPATPTVRHDAPTPGRSDSVAARSVDPSAPALQSTSASPAPSDATASADVPSPIAPAEAPLLDPGHASVETPAAASRPAPRAEARDDASFEVPPVPGAVTAAEGMTLGDPSRPPGAALGFVAEDASRSIMAAADAGPELAVQPTSTTVAPDARGALAVPNEVEIPVPPLLDLTIARAARRAQVVEITIDWIPGADPWDEPEQLEAARETARSFEDEGIQIIFRRGRELPAASYDPGRGLQPFDFAVVGPAGPVLLDALVLLDRANLITQRPGALEVVLAPVALPNRFDSARPMPELVYSDGLEGDAEAAAEVNGPGAVVPATAGARPREARPTVGEAAAANVETVQMVVDWVAGQDPWHGLAERTSELVHRLERQGIRLEFVAGRPVSPAEYAEAPAQPASEFVLPTGHGPVSLGDAAWLNQAVLRRQRPGLMHVLLAPQPVSPRERAFEPVLPELTFAESEVEGGEDPAGTAATIARRGDAQTPTIAPSILPSLPSTIPTAPATSPLGGASRELTALPLTPAARIETSTKSAAPTTTPGLVPLRREPVPPARDGADPFARGWPPFLGEGSEEWAPPDDQPLDVRVSGRSGLGARRADQERPLALPGEFAAEVVERSEDGLGAGPARGVAGQSAGLGDLGLDSGRPSGATARPLWDNTTAMSLLVYDITTVDGESEPSRSSGARAGGWPAGPAIGSALTYVHEGQEREPSQVPSVDRFNGYVIPSTLVYVSEGELMTAEPRQAARAAADRQPVSTGSSVQRVVTDTAATPEGGSTQQSPNLETLAREVYREIKWRLVVEHERAGTRRPTRGW